MRVEKVMVELERDNFEPDLCVWRAAEHRFDRAQVLYPRPDLAVEVLSPKTRQRDLGKRKREYGPAGTREYWVVDTDAETLTRYVNDGRGFGTVAEAPARGRVFRSVAATPSNARCCRPWASRWRRSGGTICGWPGRSG